MSVESLTSRALPAPAWAAERTRAALRALAVIGVATATAYVLAWQPFLATGAVLGGLLLWVTFSFPLVVIGANLALGPLDLSFLTGGFKGLLPSLGGLDMNGIRLVGMTAGLLLVVGTDKALVRSLTSRASVVYLLFLVFAGASLIWSPDPMEGARLLFKLAYPLLVFVIVSAPGRTTAEIDRLALATLIGATLIVAMNPAFVLVGGVERDSTTGLIRLQGVGIHQNPFSFYLLIVVFMCVARFAVRAQVRYLVLGFFAAMWMVLTLTRITLGAAVLGLTAMSLYGVLVNRNYRAGLAGLGVAALLGMVLTPVVLQRSFGHMPSVGEIASLARSPIGLFYAINWQGRELLWPVLANAWANSPWIGYGLGGSRTALETGLPGLGMVPHNEYLRLGVDSGWLGVGLFFSACMAWLGETVRAGRAGNAVVREYALPALAGMLAWGMISATDNAFDYYGPLTQFVGFFVAGAVVAGRETNSEGFLDPSSGPPVA
jgi:hypothetical protein